jgi:hypothetical protein
VVSSVVCFPVKLVVGWEKMPENFCARVGGEKVVPDFL